MAEEKRLGEYLIARGLIEQSQLDVALEEQKTSGQLLGQILVDMDALEREELQRSLADMFGIEKVSAADLNPDPEAQRLLSRDVAERLSAFPIRFDESSVTVMTPDPMNAELRDELQRRSGRFVEMRWASKDLVNRTIRRFYRQGEAIREVETRIAEHIEASIRQVRQREGGEAELSEAAPVVDLIDDLLRLAVQRRASDMHIEPGGSSMQVRFRIDGVLRAGPRLPMELQSVVTTRLKIIGNMDISESRLPQDGRAMKEIDGEAVDMRLSSFPIMSGESLVVRLLQKERLVRGLEELGLAEDQLEKFRREVRRPHGILLVTGPTGSGKTTTLYSTLMELDSRERNIMTVEDPVEYGLEGIRQSQINVKSGLTFAVGLRSILRQDPDVIFVGEIRDSETMEIAVRSALTGHLVFSTLHTNDAAGAIPRLMNMGAEPYLLSSSLAGVLAQRLVRLLCPHCSESAGLSERERRELERLGVEPTPEQLEGLRAAPGCHECDGSGFRDRIGIFEFLEITPRIQRLVLEGESAGGLRGAAVEEGMTTMVEHGLERVFQGETTVEEVLQVAI